MKRNDNIKSVVVAGLVAAVSAMAVPDASLAREFNTRSSSEIAIEGQKTVVLESINGSVTVIGEDRDDILLKLTKRCVADDGEEADEIFALMELKMSRTDEIVMFEAVYPKKYQAKRSILSFIVNRRPRMSMEVELILPKGLGAGVTIASGKVLVAEVGAAVSVNSASGAVEIRDVGGRVEATVSSGRLDVSDVSGDVDLQVDSGELDARDIAGNASARVSSGTIELAHIGGGLDCTIEYGTVVVDGVGDLEFEGISAESRFTGVRGAIRASTASGASSFRVMPEKDVDYTIIASSGDISVRFVDVMPGGYLFKAATTSGEITVTLPIEVKAVGRNSITGVVREGKAKIFLETASGDIIIEEPEE